MADKIAKIKGNEVQDFDLAEATAGTSASVTNTTSVMVKTSTGGYVQIPRDELVKAVASVMASNSQTTFSSLLGVTSNGAPMGINAANLASVLGGQYKALNDGDDLNNCTTDGVFYFASGAKNISNQPNGEPNYLVTTRVHGSSLGRKIQFLYSFNSDKLRYRRLFSDVSSNWSDWREIPYNIPSFYKNYSTLYSLRTAIGKVEFVDMGLPSNTLWASKNLGAETITDYGAYFSWGNVKGQKPNGTTFSSTWGTGNDTEPYVSSEGAALTGEIPVQQDAANFYLGGNCRMPSNTQFAELFNSSYTKYIDATGADVTGTDKLITLHGVKGIYLKSKINGNTLFFPCAGYGLGTSLSSAGSYGNYWARSLYSAASGYSLHFDSVGVYPQYNSGRYYGFSVRAVQ